MLITDLRRNLLGAAIVTACAVGAGTALAAPQLSEDPTEPLSALGGLDASTVSLPHAIATIESQTGNKVMDIRFASNSGEAIYDAVVVRPHHVGIARVDGKTGTLSGIADDEVSLGSLGRAQRDNVASFEKATVPLTTAIENVERLSGGHVIDAGLASPLAPDSDVLAYNVEYAKDGAVHTLAIDANTGEVIANPGALGLSEDDPSDFLPGAAE